MLIYYKLLKDGSRVRIFRTLMENEKITAKQFFKKAIVADARKIEKKLPNKCANVILSQMRRINVLNNMKINQFGGIFDNQIGRHVYFVGNCVFNDLEDAMIHGQNIYGISFMQYNKDKLEDGKWHYFREGYEISEKEYYSLVKEYEELLELKCFKLEKENKPKLSKR